MKKKSRERDKFFYSDRQKEDKIFSEKIKIDIERSFHIAIHKVFCGKEEANKIRLLYELEDSLVINNNKEKRMKI